MTGCYNGRNFLLFLEGQQGAAALWEALRAFSRQKLVNKDALILPDVKVQ